jgi:hypothetical protein
MTDRLIRITTALAVATVAAVAAVISYRHELVSAHGETGLTARSSRSTLTDSSWQPASLTGARNLYRNWRGGAWALASWPPLAPTWRTA